MRKHQYYPLALIVISIIGLLGCFAFVWSQSRNVISQHNLAWARRIATLAQRRQQDFMPWQNSHPPQDIQSLYSSAAAQREVLAFLLLDIKKRSVESWTDPQFDGSLRSLDPRLGVIQRMVLDKQQPAAGPLIYIRDVPYWTYVHPAGPNRVIVSFVRDAGFLTLVRDEVRLWNVSAYIRDFEGNVIFASDDKPEKDVWLQKASQRAIKKQSSGRLSAGGITKWRRIVSYDFFKPLDWILVVAEDAPWVVLPFLLMSLGVLGAFLLVRPPLIAAQKLQTQRFTQALNKFSIRVDNFARGRDPVLKEPPPPLEELTPVVNTLRWLMPQWKKAEAFPQELILEKKLLTLLIESLPEGILFFNLQGQLQLANELGRVFLTLQQEAGHEVRMVNGISVTRGFLEPFLEPVLTGVQNNLGKEVEVTWADGKHLYRVWVEKVEAEPGKSLGFICVVRDITFRRQWEYVQEQLLSGITHDLRGPLSALMGYIDLVRRQMGEGTAPKIIEYLGLAKESGVRLSQMVSDILDVVRFEQGRIDMQTETYSLAQLFQRLQNTFGVLAEQKKVHLMIELRGDPGMQVHADPKLLDRVLDNLIGNAIKFTPSRGTITVVGKKEGGRIYFEITDTGRGIPREAQSRIFDKFQQVRPGDRSAGYGLGLAVAKFIVDAHKGEITVESEVGVGSKFSFWVPDTIPPPNTETPTA